MTSSSEFDRMPFHKVIGLQLDQLTDDQLREVIKVYNSDSQCAPARRAKAKRESKKIEGKAPQEINLEDLL